MAIVRRCWASAGLWLGIPLLQVAGLAHLLVTRAPEPGTSTAALAIVFPPWWPEERVVAAVSSRGLVPVPAGVRFVAIVPAASVSVPGEWFRLSLPSSIFCSPKGDEP